MRKVKRLSSRKDIADFVTLKSLLAHVPTSERTLHRYIKAGKLRAYKLDGKLIFNIADIEAFLSRRKIGGGTTAPILKERSISPAPASVRVLSDDEAKTFFDNRPNFLQPGWKPINLFDFDGPPLEQNATPAEKEAAAKAARKLLRSKGVKNVI